MANMYITEYSAVGDDKYGRDIQAGLEGDSTVYQKVAFTSTHGVSATFSNRAKVVRITLDTAGYIKFGAAPVSVTGTNTPMQANTPEYFSVTPGLRVSAVT